MLFLILFSYHSQSTASSSSLYLCAKIRTESKSDIPWHGITRRQRLGARDCALPALRQHLRMSLP
uniref:Uncharacterized protein n=1 Tax=Rhizophora mucronata TaxID=61149 RepID=A0A2P2N0I3_RHIMU